MLANVTMQNLKSLYQLEMETAEKENKTQLVTKQQNQHLQD